MPLFRYQRCWLWVVLLLNPHLAMAVLNVEQVRPARDQAGWSGSAQVGFNGAGGNTDKLVIATSGALVWNAHAYQDFWLASYKYGESNGVRDTDALSTHLRHVQFISTYYALEAFGQVERNDFARIELRSLLGIGGRREHIGGIDFPLVVHLGLGVFYLNEEVEAVSGSPAASNHDARGNVYLVLQKKLHETLSFTSTTYAQPSLLDSADYVVTEEFAAEVSVIGALALVTELSWRYDSMPPDFVEASDYNYNVALKYNF